MSERGRRTPKPTAPVSSNARAFAWSLAVHAIAFGLLFVGLRWTQSEKPLSVAGPVIEAALVIDPDAKTPPVAKPQPKPKPPKPKPKPKPEPEVVKPPEPDPVLDPTPPRAEDPRDQEFIDELGLLEAEEREREQEEMRRREQIELEAEERLERERREFERDEQLEDIERLRREEEERRMEELLEEEERARQDAQPRPGNEGVDESLLAQYAMALSQVIETNWTRPDTVPLGMRCKIVIIQAPGGEVVGARVDPSCPYDDIGRRSLEAAVMKASPLPYDGFEDVFNPQLNLTFTPDDRY